MYTPGQEKSRETFLKAPHPASHGAAMEGVLEAGADGEGRGEEQKLPAPSRSRYPADVARSRPCPMAREGPELVYTPPGEPLSKAAPGDPDVARASADQPTAAHPASLPSAAGMIFGADAEAKRCATSSAFEACPLFPAASPPVSVYGCGNTVSGVLADDFGTNPIAARMLQRRARRYASSAGSGQELINDPLFISSDDAVTGNVDNNNDKSNTLRQQPAQPLDTRKKVSKGNLRPMFRELVFEFGGG